MIVCKILILNLDDNVCVFVSQPGVSYFVYDITMLYEVFFYIDRVPFLP